MNECHARQQRPGYFYDISRARYVIRRLFRIFDDHARDFGLESLQHQALIQVAGRDEGDGVKVSELAHALDIPTAFASRIATKLSNMSLIERGSFDGDKRVTMLTISEQGIRTLNSISQNVVRDMDYFRGSLTAADKAAALRVFFTYVGLDPRLQVSLESLLADGNDSVGSM